MLTFPTAKINLGLFVTGRRPDGYHNIETIFYPIHLKDALEVIEADQLSFTSSGIPIPGTADENLCLRAYALLKKEYALPPVRIHLHKHIPIGAGLGGGSADAAFLIRLLNEKFALNLPVEKMQTYARQLGADCAFFIENKPAYAFGKGDWFSPVALNLDAYCIVLVMPPVHVSTGEAYRGVRPAPSTIDLKEAIQQPITEWKRLLKNDFEPSIFKDHPQLRGIKAALYEAGALYAAMSGSGAAMYGVFDREVKLEELEQGNEVFYG